MATRNGSRRRRSRSTEGQQSPLTYAADPNEHLDTSTLETWLWDAACAVRGAADAPKFKDFILPLIFFKRLSDVFDDRFAKQIEEFGDEESAWEIVRHDHQDALRTGRRPITGFIVPQEYNWRAIRHHATDGRLGEFVTTAMREVAKLNPQLDGVVNVRDFNETQSGQRTLDDDRLATLIEVISRHRLGLKNAEPDVLGRAYEYLLRKFAEGQGQSAGEFYTPYEVAWLMARLIDPRPSSEAYDPACGSAGLLIKTRLVFRENHPGNDLEPRMFGQELNPTTFAMAKMNAFLHDFEDAQFAIGDTFANPGFNPKPGANGKAGLRRFDYVVANPMWNQDNYDDDFYDNDPFDRFTHGNPPRSSADWGWAQHILASLQPNGRAAIVLDTGAVSRGSGSRSSNREREIRKAFVEDDLVEGVVLLPDNLFYTTTAPGIILLLNRAKPADRRGQTILVNASLHFTKRKPKNVLTDEGIAAAVDAYRAWETRPKLSRVVTLDEFRAADYNLSPSQFVEVADRIEHRPLPAILADLAAARAERERADAALNQVLADLGLLEPAVSAKL